MVGEPQINMVGSLVADPELPSRPPGVAAASVRIAVTPRSRDNATGEWKDRGDRPGLSRHGGANTPRTSPSPSRKGTRVIVIGRLKQRSYETREGEAHGLRGRHRRHRSGPARYATAKIRDQPRLLHRRRPRSSGWRRWR